MQAIEDLTLKSPFELGIVQIAGMQLKVIRMDRGIGEARPDDDFDGVVFGAGIELHQRMFVEAELLLHAGQAVGTHPAIVDDTRYSYLRASMGSSLDALMAGSMPLTRPTNPKMMVATTTIVGSMIRRMSAASAFFAMAL